MSNRKAVREQLLKQAGWEKQANGKWKSGGMIYVPSERETCVCFTCKSCWRRSLQSDLNNLQCPFCGSAMYEGGKP